MTDNCPYCNRAIRHMVNSDRHDSICPKNKRNYEKYRNALEDPNDKGTLRMIRDYENTRGELVCVKTLRGIYGVSWSALGKIFSLTPKEERKTDRWLDDEIRRLGTLIDIEILHNIHAANEAKLERSRQGGLKVLRYETRRVGDVYQRTYIIR